MQTRHLCRRTTTRADTRPVSCKVMYGIRSWAAVLVVAAMTLLAAAPSASAQSLEELRASGAIGERYDGYVVPRDPSAKGAAERINKQRREIYETRANEQGVSAEEVGKVYAQQIIEQAPKNTWFLGPDHKWRQK